MIEQLEQHLKQLSDRVAADPEFTPFNLPQLARPAVRLVAQQVSEQPLSLGESRIGGLPDVPPGFEWPRWLPSHEQQDKYGQPWQPEKPVPLGFIAQIDLQAIPRIDEALPQVGWLYFFYDRYCEPWGFNPADREGCRILYAHCDRSALQPAQLPADADEEHIAEACRIEARLELILPDDLDEVEYDTPLFEAYQALRKELSGANGETHHHLLGYPQVIQNPMELQCQLVSHGIYCGNSDGYNSDEAEALAGGAQDWRLLLQIDSDEEGPGWMFGDAGRIYYWVKQDDLAALQFQNAWLILQCY